MRELSKKRKRVIYIILIVTIVNMLVTAAPFPLIDITIKKLSLTFANVVMFILVWDTYFDEQLSQKNVFSILQDLFAVTCLSLITTFILALGITIAIERSIAFLGYWGWFFAGAIAGIMTAILGLIWASYCDDLYRNSPS